MNTRRKSRLVVSGLAVLAMLATTAACSSPAPSTPKETVDPKAPVTITIGGEPPTEQAESRQAYLDAIKVFMDAHPNITVQPTEISWNVTTFPAMVAGGTLPTTMTVAVTDVLPLASRGQIANLTNYVKGDTVLDGLNPAVANLVRNAKGETFGIPVSAWCVGLVYNRALFVQAGLDPNKPPTTWEQVREYAKQISEKTGQAGFMSQTRENVGGFLLSSLSYAFGSELEKTDGDKTTATINQSATKDALTMLQQMRWTDNSLGSNFLINVIDILNEFGAGHVGMMVTGADNYPDLVINRGLPPADYGLTVLPQVKGGIGALGGGSVAIVSPTATPNQIAAAIEWNKYYYLGNYLNQDQAVTNAKAGAADGRPVGTPGIPVVSQQQYDTYRGWIKDYINVDATHFAPFMDNLKSVPIVIEPRVKTQELYAALDPVVQAVLTQQGADIGALLSAAEADINAIIAAG